MIRDLLPRQVVAVESHGADAPLAPLRPLFSAEEAVIAGAAPKRRREFTAVRGCAHAALEGLRLPAAPVLPGTDGAPRWPAGVVGSMTHGGGYHAAALAHGALMLTVGIDAEKDAPCPDGVLRHIARETELRRHSRLSRDEPEVNWDRLLFSAKESVYKAWYPLAGCRLGFLEADVTLRPDGTFTAVLLADVPPHAKTGTASAPPLAFEGRWLAEQGLLITAIAVSRHG
jgi:enterobactin synthetase component D / holo-[acyl-carrier protein] synthase